MFIISSTWLIQLVKPVSLSRVEIAKIKETKIMSVNPNKIPIVFGISKNKINKNKIDLNKTRYLNMAIIENE